IHAALERAREAAGGKDVRIGGGVATMRQFMQARLIDELHLVLRPVVLGEGENLFEGLDASALGYEVAEAGAGERATHMFVRKGGGSARARFSVRRALRAGGARARAGPRP